jgi:hypothetical protein
MRRSRANVRRRATAAPAYSRIFLFGPVLIVVAAFLAIFLLAQSPGTASPAGSGAEPTKPQGNQTDNSLTSEKWTVAKGLPTKVMRLAFSAADSSRGYAVAFVNKQSQTVYITADRGANWSQAGSFNGPVGDYISTDPLDAQDVVVLFSYAPKPGEYIVQRSLDGGKTWSTQSTTLTTTGQISQIGWSDSTFLLGMQLDGQLQGSSAVVAFPKGQPGVHLDVNGTLNGQAIKHLRLLTGNKNKIVVWGDDGSASQNVTGLATRDAGKTWAALPNTTPGAKLKPTASSHPRQVKGLQAGNVVRAIWAVNVPHGHNSCFFSQSPVGLRNQRSAKYLGLGLDCCTFEISRPLEASQVWAGVPAKHGLQNKLPLGRFDHSSIITSVTTGGWRRKCPNRHPLGRGRVAF